MRPRLSIVAAFAAAPAIVALLATAITAPAALAAAPRATPTPAPASNASGAQAAADSAQEITLDGLGQTSQTLFGRSNVISAFFPAPPAPLAPDGSLVRLYFAHSPLLDPTSSSIKVRVNGQELGSVQLDPGSADGAVVEVRVPTAVLHGDRANLVELRVDMRLAGRPADAVDDPSAFTRLEGQTLLHYQLYGPPGSAPPARLNAFPFPLVGNHGIAPARLGVVMPDPPTDSDLVAAYSLVADIGRRSLGQEVAPQVITANQLDWLKAGGAPALVVGIEGRLPAADAALRAAGFLANTAGWMAPDGQQAGPDDGIVAAVTSPWDHHSPIIVATGLSSSGVTRATAALTTPDSLPPNTSYFLVHPGYPAPQPDTSARPGSVMPLPALQDQEVKIQGAGHKTLSLTFISPAVDPQASGDIEMAVSHSSLAPAKRSMLSIELNGSVAGSALLHRSNENHARIHVRLPGGLFHPGRNTLVFDFTLAGDDSSSVDLGPAVSLRLPVGPSGQPGLELLPYPVFDDPGGVRLVLADAADPVLTAAARFVAALGSRSTVLPKLSAMFATEAAEAALSSSSLVIVGVSTQSPTADRISRLLHRPAMPAGLTGGPGQSFGVVQELAAAGSRTHSVLWVDGTNAAALSLAGEALYRGALSGSAVSVDASGHVRAFAQDVGRGEPAAVTAVKILIALAAGLLVLVVAWDAWQPRAEEFVNGG